MAYLDLREPLAAAPIPTAEALGFAAPHTMLARTEWQVVMLAEKDGLSSLSEPGRVSRLLAWLFGGSASRKLADPRLEALRRFAVLAWHRGAALPAAAVGQFLEAGFSQSQLDLVVASIAGARTARPAR